MIRHCMRLFLSFLLGFAWVSCALGKPPSFYFTAVPNQDEGELLRRFGKVAIYLEGKLGVPVSYVPLSSYEAAVDAFASDRVQLGWFGAYSGIQARHAVPNSQAIAQGAEDIGFKSYFIANASTGLQPSKDLPEAMRGKSFAFGSPLSTSGRLVPEFWIRQRFHQSPARVFSRVSFSGDHSSTIDLVQAGVVDAGALNYTVFEAAKKAGKIDPEKVTVIWETPPFPDNAFIVRGDVDKTFGNGFIKKVQRAILDLNDKDILKSFARSKFIPATNEQYEFIEELASILKAEEQEKIKK